MRTVVRRGEHFLQAADLQAKGACRHLLNVAVLLLEQQIVQRHPARHCDVVAIPDILFRLPVQMRRSVREPQPLHCTHHI